MDRAELIHKMQQTQRESQETYSRVVRLEHKIQDLEKYVHLVMRGPKGDRGEDGADFDLTEEDVKNAVRDGVVEGLQEFVEGLKYQGARDSKGDKGADGIDGFVCGLTEEDIKNASNIPWGF